MRGLAIGGIIIKRRPLAVVLREVWERALCCAVLRRDHVAAEWLARAYDGYETEAEKAGRN